MGKSISTKLSDENIAQIKEILFTSSAKLEEMSNGFTEENLTKPLSPQKRSFKEDLAHLLNCEATTITQITLALLKNEPLLDPIHPERDYGKLFSLTELNLFDLLNYFKLRRMILKRVLNELGKTQWSRLVEEKGKKRKESIYWKFRSLALHEKEHLAIIEKRISENN